MEDVPVLGKILWPFGRVHFLLWLHRSGRRWNFPLAGPGVATINTGNSRD